MNRLEQTTGQILGEVIEVTLIVTVNGRESIWLLADRRLSYGNRAPKDDARKVMFLETTDGVAILGYAGLGATASGTEPADWMSAVLRGRNFPLEQSLGVVAEAMKTQFPRHMVQMPGRNGPAHCVLVTAFLGSEVRLYTIDLVFAPNRKDFQFRYTRHVDPRPSLAMGQAPRIGLAGSGKSYLLGNKTWKRPLLRLVSAYDHGQVSSHAVADHLASLNNKVHVDGRDKFVGPRCIVAWRNRKKGVHKGGGGHQFFTNTQRDTSSSVLPTIANGMNVSDLLLLLISNKLPPFDIMRPGDPATVLDKDEFNAKLALLPDKPDENLR